MEELKELKRILQEQRPNNWEDIPDIDLYMDQVLNYMVRQHIGLESGETLTSAMVNNYIKKELLPRAKGKRYERQHIAYLTAICLFKQILSVDSTKELLKSQLADSDIKSFYEKYCVKLDQEYTGVAEKIDEKMTKQDISELVLELAISSYAQKIACERLLELLV
ncbi:DUF1836 domain-containing protein [Aminipila luticellarii]|uniref:DUF1836 domain-containing protein n=1 Tax=Aminipila luticellarii TaxID=2507160 RepID=A0A410PTE6_9FIRM|nr:DUF1836 domain-containing protein [Aminipila luticellarii]QAT42184.1 DUF1836 domain-containing protein [Aminipila luticellarii]